MDEEKKPEGEEKKTAPADSAEGNKYETTPVIERAREERERMEKVVKELKAENDRRELIMAKQALGGNTEAGQGTEVSDEEKKKQGAKEFFKGTVIEKALEKHG